MSERVLHEWEDCGCKWSVRDGVAIFGGDPVVCRECVEIESGVLARELARLAARVRELEGANAKLRAALLPFSDDELCRELGGNVEGDESPVFQRGSMKEPLRLKHFRAARAEVDK